MRNLKLSLINNDYAIQAHTDLSVSDKMMDHFVDFLNEMKEELVSAHP